jgi:hypothetical protein
VNRAWARIDGSVAFLVSFGGRTARIAKTLEYARLGGAPAYRAINLVRVCGPGNDYGKLSNLAAVAAIRFERVYQPERHNLYNNWDVVQAHRRAPDRAWDEGLYRSERARDDRQELSTLLKVARSAPEKLPRVFSVRSDVFPKSYRVRFPWGVVRVGSYTQPLGVPHYDCSDSCSKAEDPNLARRLSCAAILLYEFPKLVGTNRQ